MPAKEAGAVSFPDEAWPDPEVEMSSARCRSLPALMALAVVGVLPPAGLGAPKAKPKPKAPTRSTPAKRKPAAAKPKQPENPVVAALKQVESGPGVLVCEPVVTAEGRDLPAFARGCGRWLHLVVGGQGELGRTPLWKSVDHARRELVRDNLQLSLDEAVKLRRSLGITHVALGELTGKADLFVLTYRVWELTGKKPVGEPVVASGFDQQIAARLPEMARGLAASVGVPNPIVPEATGENAHELRLLGKMPWLPDDTLSVADQSELYLISRRGSRGAPGDGAPRILALMLCVIRAGSFKDGPLVREVSPLLVRALPVNALALGEIGYQSFACRNVPPTTLPRAPVQQMLGRFPNNALYNTALTYFDRIAGDFAAAKKSARQAVRCATGNPDAWLMLAGTLYGEADQTRKGRFSTAMTEQELDLVNKLYVEELLTAIHAVELDPEYGDAWKEVSASAAFAGDGNLADAALQKGLECDSGNSELYRWGIQLYQPKWNDNPEKLARIGRQAVAAAETWSPRRRLEIAVNLHHAGLEDLARQVLRTDEERAALKRHLEGPH